MANYPTIFWVAALHLCLWCAPPIAAQTQDKEIRFKELNLAEGLSQSSVRAMIQDSIGFLWFGTQEGLNLFDGYQFTVYRHDPEDPSSLSSSYIYSLLEDKDGAIWVGTWGSGVSRFDRNQQVFRHMKRNPDHAYGLRSDRIWSLFQSPDGQVWVGTELSGLAIYDPAIEDFIAPGFDRLKPENLGAETIRHVSRDSAGRMWFASDTGGLVRLDPNSNRFVHYRHDPQNPLSIGSNRVYMSTEDRLGRLWVATDGGGLALLNPDTETFQRMGSPSSPALPDRVAAVLEDKSGLLWVAGIDGGLSRLDPDTQSVTRFRHNPSDNNSLSSDFLYTMLQDSSGLIWLGTDGGGVNQFDPKGTGFRLYRNNPKDPSSLSMNKVFAIGEDPNGFLWVSTQTGGLNRLDLTTRTFKHFPYQEYAHTGVPREVSYAMTRDDNGRLWIGSQGGGLLRYDPKENRFITYRHDPEQADGPSDNRVYSLSKGQPGELLVGSFGAGFSIMDLESETFEHFVHDPQDPRSLSNNRVSSFLYDSGGRLWVGTLGGGLNRQDPGGNGFNRYQYMEGRLDGIGGNLIFAFHEERDGLVWIGTDNGLCRWDGANDQFKVFRRRHGLPNNFIYGILEDDRGRLWMSTNYGLSCLDRKTMTFRNFDSYDGLQSNEFNSGAFYRHSTGELFFGGINGLNGFQPEDLDESRYEPPLVLTRLLINNQPEFPDPGGEGPLRNVISQAESVTLNHRQGMFTIEFAALDFTMPERNRYAYQLTGYSPEWIHTTAANRRATYTDLPEGTYRFRVKGGNHDGVWSGQKAAVTLHILSHPLWSWWARSLYALAAALLIGLYIYLQRRNLIHERQVSTRLRQVDQLREEFLANTSHELRTPLHGIIGLAESALDMAPDHPLQPQVHDNLTLIVSSGKRMANLVNDILDFSKLKNESLTLQCGRVDPRIAADVVLNLVRPLAQSAGLELRNAVPTNLPGIRADENRLLQILQNLVGNALKFTAQGHIEIGAEMSKNNLIMTVSDTGIGIRQEHFEKIFQSFEQAEGGVNREFGGTGLGLAVTRKLVELHGGRIWVDSTFGEGSVFSFSLPMEAPVNAPENTTDEPTPQRTLTQNTAQLMLSGVLGPQVTGDGFRILIVDDEPVNRRVLVNHLSGQNYHLHEAGNGLEAMDAVRDGPFDLVLLDIMMPKMTGYEVCSKLREQYPRGELPVIFLTARNQVGDIVAGFNHGGNDFLTKPVLKGELLVRVTTHLELLGINRDLEEKVMERTQHLLDVQRELMEEAHTAGMAEVAVEILHQIGNRLNSLGTSTQVLEEIAADNRFIQLLLKIGTAMDQAGTGNESGEDAVPVPHKFIAAHHKITDQVSQQFQQIGRESHELQDHAEHMRVILQEQQEYAKAKGAVEDQDLNQLVVEGLRMAAAVLEENRIDIQLDLDPANPKIRVNRARFIRVLLCLYHNAGEALANVEGRIRVTTQVGSDKVTMSLVDNGVGISAEHMPLIYQHGFSTKEGRNGFGLHYSANAIKEMGGELRITSDGPGCGAGVVLIFPGSGQ